MPTASASVANALMDRIHLTESTEVLAERYKAAMPFPHLVFDNMFDNQLLDDLLNEIPDVSKNRDNWVQYDDEHLVKFNLRSPLSLAKTGAALTGFLQSAGFLYLLSEITGIWGLLPDPYLQGAGYHMIPPGGKFNVHTDRLTDYTTGLKRKLAFIIYLNKNWKSEYGGQLELWDRTGSRCEEVIEPVFNRTVLFESSDTSFHGHPNPIACPPGMSRRSFCLFYYTVSESGENTVDMKSSVYAPSFYQKNLSVRRLVRDLTPPAVLRVMQKARRGIK